jgi:hypothetical protein
VDAATDRGAAGGGSPTRTELLSQGALHELGKWIHDLSPMERTVGETRGGRRGEDIRRRRPGRLRSDVPLCPPVHRWPKVTLDIILKLMSRQRVGRVAFRC